MDAIFIHQEMPRRRYHAGKKTPGLQAHTQMRATLLAHLPRLPPTRTKPRRGIVSLATFVLLQVFIEGQITIVARSGHGADKRDKAAARVGNHGAGHGGLEGVRVVNAVGARDGAFVEAEEAAGHSLFYFFWDGWNLCVGVGVSVFVRVVEDMVSASSLSLVYRKGRRQREGGSGGAEASLQRMLVLEGSVCVCVCVNV